MATRPLIHATNKGINLVESGGNGELSLDFTNAPDLGVAPAVGDEILVGDADDSNLPKAITVTELNGALTIDALSDTTLTALGDNEVLVSSSGSFINNTLAEAGISAVGHTQAASTITAATFGAGNYVFPDDLTIGSGSEFFFDESINFFGIKSTTPDNGTSEDIVLQINDFGDTDADQIIQLFGGVGATIEVIGDVTGPNTLNHARLHIATNTNNDQTLSGGVLGHIAFGANAIGAPGSTKDDIYYSCSIVGFADGDWDDPATAPAGFKFYVGTVGDTGRTPTAVPGDILALTIEDSGNCVWDGASGLGMWYDFTNKALSIGNTTSPTCTLDVQTSYSSGYIRLWYLV